MMFSIIKLKGKFTFRKTFDICYILVYLRDVHAYFFSLPPSFIEKIEFQSAIWRLCKTPCVGPGQESWITQLGLSGGTEITNLDMSSVPIDFSLGRFPGAWIMYMDCGQGVLTTYMDHDQRSYMTRYLKLWQPSLGPLIMVHICCWDPLTMVHIRCSGALEISVKRSQ